MYSVITRTWLFGSLNTSANSSRTLAVPCVEAYTVISSGFQSTTKPCVSSAEWVCTWVKYSPSTTASASAKPCSTSPTFFRLRAVHVADLRHILRTAAAARASRRIRRSRETPSAHRRLARVLLVHDKRHLVVRDLDEMPRRRPRSAE